MSQNRNEKCQYEPIPHEETLELLSEFEVSWLHFIQIAGYPSDLIYNVSTYDMVDVISRVDKRDAYFYFFHDMEICEKKRLALFIYWIMKFKPYTITDIRYINSKKTVTINERFSIYLMSIVLFYCQSLDDDVETVEVSKYYQKLLYSFKYRDLSMESIMLIVESVSKELFLPEIVV